jgi:flavin-dependent dehydrogenase
MILDPSVITDSDVVVIGGGPAGAICALSLARRGVRVSLIHHGRNRFGAIELVSGRARGFLESLLKQPLIEVVRGIEVNETISLWGTASPVTWNAMCNPYGAGIAVERPAFDEALRKVVSSAGVSMLSGSIVLGVERKENLWQLIIQHDHGRKLLRARFLVVATGRSCTITLDRRPVVMSSMLTLTTRVRTNTIEQDHTLYLESSSNGWWYALPDRQNVRFVGFCTRPESLKQKRSSLQDLFLHELVRTRLLAHLISHVKDPIPVLVYVTNVQAYDKITGPCWLAVGDAAFASDPLSGMGIEFAIESAVRGAHALCRGPKLDAPILYKNWVNEYVKQHQRMLTLYTRDINIHQNQQRPKTIGSQST